MTLNTDYLKSGSASCTRINCLGSIVMLLLFITNSFLFFFIFKEGFNEKIVIIMHYRRLTIAVVKDIHREKAPSNKTLALTKSRNMGIWLVGTSCQLKKWYSSFLKSFSFSRNSVSKLKY